MSNYLAEGVRLLMRKVRLFQWKKKRYYLTDPEGFQRPRYQFWTDRAVGGRCSWQWCANHLSGGILDSMLDDGTKVVLQFLSKNGRTFASNEFHPTIFFKVTMPDGRQINKEYNLKPKDIEWSRDTCDVHFGPHYVKGDLKHYEIHMELKDGMAADFTMDSISKPYRPGTSYFQFGEPEKYYTWLCVVPRGKVSGKLTVEGKTVDVSGTGYHDHQWGSINFHKYWNHWIWARQSFDDYSMLLFDFFTNEEFGSKRFPILFIQDER